MAFLAFNILAFAADGLPLPASAVAAPDAAADEPPPPISSTGVCSTGASPTLLPLFL
eukprot:CAMPEP_0205942760 /NCGR_PEP_ID=MMETSP1325-20131115/58586_1 /ASSEMBLY_ACC=CAM_ASM_000708 /TAXON_ID=236786 /ORGANISM="Florenciella sp., Strain RCC1007" /LENGTH=56 /DNA_ID=CAMNT_0053313515 /DNA_START=250 /DNA_END=417 /DNA_ORIENTATION=-